MRRQPSIRATVAALVCGAGFLAPVALAGPGGSAALTSSSGAWISTTTAGSATPHSFTQLATDTVSNDTAITTESDASPSSAFNASGAGVVAWENTSGDHVEASFIEPGGTWSEPALVGTGHNPVVAVDPAGDAVIVFQETAPGAESVAYAYSPAGSGRFGPAVKIDGRTPEGRPRVVLDSSGNAWVTWSDGYGYPGTAGQVARLSAAQLASGASDSSSSDPVAVGVLGGDAGSLGRAVLATSSSGGVIAAWVAPAAGNPFSDQIDAAYAAPGQTSFGPARALPGSNGGSLSPSVAMNSSGGAVVAWAECQQSDDRPFCDDPRAVEVASASAAQLAASGGPTFTAAQSLAPSSQGGDLGKDNGAANGEFAPSVAVNDDEVVVTWEDFTTSFVVDGAVEPLADLQSATANWSELSGIPARYDEDATGTAYSGGPQVAIDTNGDVALAWNDGDAINVAAAAACASSCPSMTVTQLDSHAAGAGYDATSLRPSLASDANGDLLLSWLSDANPRISPATVVAMYDAGPVVTNVEIPATAVTGSAAGFSIDTDDVWAGLSGPVTSTWSFGDGASATGPDVSHTYTTPGTYTVTVVSRAADGASSTVSAAGGASSTVSGQIQVSAAATTTVTTASSQTVSNPTWIGAAWRSSSRAGSVGAEFTVPALVCSGKSAGGQELGAQVRGRASGSSTTLTDFAGVDVRCAHGHASYAATFTIGNLDGGFTTVKPAALTVAPGDLLSAQIARGSSGERLKLTDLSQPGEKAAATDGRAFATRTGWQVGAFPIPGVKGPVQTLATPFIDVEAGGTGLSHLKALTKHTWGPARVSRIGGAENQFSVLYHRTPQARVGGGSNAIPANGSDAYELPRTHKFVPLHSSAQLPNGTVIDATGGTVQLTSSEPGGQTQSVTAWGGEFKITNKSNGATVLTVAGTWNGSASASSAAANGKLSHRRSKHKKQVVSGNLWAKGHGNLTTQGNYGSAAVLGTKWLTRNVKNGTLFEVTKNPLDKNDSIRVTVYYPSRHTVILRQGQSLLAPAPVKKKQVKPGMVTLSGATESGGRYNVKIGRTYKLTVISKIRPVYVYAAVDPLGPLGGYAPFEPDGSVNGTPRWTFYFYLSSKLADFHYWAVGAKVGSKVYVIQLRIT